MIKEQFKKVTEKVFHHALNFIVDFDGEHVRYVLSRIHNQFMCLEIPYKITKEAIHPVTELCATGEVLVLRSIPKNDVERLTN